MNEKLKTIKKLMIDRDIFSEAELARRCGTSRPFIRYLLRGERTSKRYAQRMADVLGIRPERMARLLK